MFQTIKHYNVPVRILLACNGGYRGIVRSQSNMFGHYTGCTKDTGVEMPDFRKIANAFDIPYFKVNNQIELNSILEKVYEINGPVICEWPQDPNQVIEPRVMNRKDEKGCIVSTMIDDLSPFLSREEYEGNKYDNWIKNRL